MSSPVTQAERRRHERRYPRSPLRVTRAIPALPLSDAKVLNVSAGGVALITRVPVHHGERLSFHPTEGGAPVLAEVLATERCDDGFFVVRCRCILGNFE